MLNSPRQLIDCLGDECDTAQWLEGVNCGHALMGIWKTAATNSNGTPVAPSLPLEDVPKPTAVSLQGVVKNLNLEHMNPDTGEHVLHDMS